MKKTLHILRFLVGDFLAAALAWICFYTIRRHLLGEEPQRLDAELIGNSMIIGSFWIIFYAFFGLYSNIYNKSRIKEFFWLFTTTFLGAVFIFFVLLLDDEGVDNYTAYYKTFSAYFLLQFTFTAIEKISIISYTQWLLKSKRVCFNTLLIGSDQNALEILNEVEKSIETLGMHFIGYMHVFDNNSHFLKDRLRHFGHYDHLEKVIRRCNVEHIVIALEPSEHGKISQILSMLNSTNVKVHIIPDIYQLIVGSVKVKQIFGLPLIQINQDIIPVWQKATKRAIDIFISFSVLLIGMPVFVVLALVTKLSSKGPIFYTQERIGRDGIPFNIVKYRSMYIGSEQNGPALACDDDPRVTPWGRFMRKTRLDELPQFYNVLIGDMSLVGPRPERQYFIDQIVKLAPHYKHLQRVRPGITSLGQVKYGYAENVDQMVNRLKYDVLYIENMSLALDLQIIFYTIIIMIQGRGK
ncbi:sugar transferase [Cytophagaceae bacterium ABcell3]|nr:sugar transferase [Cytophagaceae bacterium ABcell3]